MPPKQLKKVGKKGGFKARATKRQQPRRPQARAKVAQRSAATRAPARVTNSGDAAAISAARCFFDPVHAKPARLPWDVRPSAPIVRKDVWAIRNVSAMPPGAQVSLWVDFSQATTYMVAMLTTSSPNMWALGNSMVPDGSEVRVLGAALELRYNGPVLDMGSSLSYVRWGKGQSGYTGAVTRDIDLTGDMYAQHERLDRHLVIPWSGGPVEWHEAVKPVWSNTPADAAVPGVRFDTAVNTNDTIARYEGNTRLPIYGTGELPPGAAMVITMPASIFQSGHLTIVAHAHVEYYHDSHAAVSKTVPPAQGGLALIETIKSHAARREAPRHGTLEQYVQRAASGMLEFARLHVPSQVATISKVIAGARAVAGKVSGAAGVVGRVASALTSLAI